MATELATPTPIKAPKPPKQASSALMDWVVWQIGLLGPMSIDELTRLAGVSKTVMERAVYGLGRQKLAIRIGFLITTSAEGKPIKGPGFWHLTPQGWATAVPMINPTLNPTEAPTLKASGLAHQSATNRFMIHLLEIIRAEQDALESANQIDALLDTGIIGWQASRLASRYYEIWEDGKLTNPQRIRPDGMVSLAFRGQQFELRVEVDRGTEGSAILREKIKRYEAQIRERKAMDKRDEAYPMNILWVIDDPKSQRRGVSRVDQTINIVYQTATDPSTPNRNADLVLDHRHWVTTLDAWESAKSLDDAVWYDPFEESPEPRASTFWTPVRTTAQIVDPEYPRRMLLN